jgi:para-nitrobenzyl esterase
MSIYNRIYALVSFLFLGPGFASFNNQNNFTPGLDLVKVEGGVISGTVNSSGDIHIFRGVPFAAPPVGNLRWKKPQQVISWTGVKACDKFGPSPMQAKPAPFSMWSEEFLIPEELPISEDCLHLNVWTGATTEKEKRPVIVWIYGGGFSSGGSAVPIYDGEAMAKKGIVFVSINYRVGIFGFFAHPELSKESVTNASGNYGLMDQVAALNWVKKNIAAFGGDPNNVTIAGQSAGSMSVNCLVASPLAKTLFQKAIAESGASLVTGPFGGTTIQTAEQDGQKTAAALNAPSIADLRKIPAIELLKAQQTIRGPIVDGYVLPQSVSNIFSESKENKVSLLTGWNEDEGLLFGPIKKADAFKEDAARNYGSEARTFLQYYPADTDSMAALSQLKLSRDQVFGIQNYTWANIQSDKGSKVFVYRFSRKVPATGDYLKYGAFHTGEVPYAYDNLQFVNRPWRQSDRQLATIMSAYIANFARNGDPNGSGLPPWAGYTSTDKKVMVFDETSSTKQLPDSAQLDFLYNQMRKK